MERTELDRHVLEFGRLLREGGITVNLTEIEDALRGLEIIGMEDKTRVEGVLQATLIKSVTQVPRFQETFRVFFATPEAQATWKSESKEQQQHWDKGMAQTYEDLRFIGNECELSEEHRVTYLQLPEAEKERIKRFLERSSEGVKNGVPVDHSFQPMVERVLRGSLDFWRRKLEEDSPLALPGKAGLLSEVERGIREKDIQYMTRDLKDISSEEWPEVMKLIRRLSQRLASQFSRRLALSKKGSLDIRRTFRENVRYGGVCLKQRYRRRRSGRPQFILLCDVSGSMVKYTEFILQFIYGLTSLVSGIETYVFADRLVNLTPKLHVVKSFQGMLHAALSEVTQEFGGGTNLNVSLEQLIKDYGSSLSRRTVLFILSDTQTLEGEKAAKLLKTIGGKVKKIVWLNTLPQRRWKETKTVELFHPLCHMFECYTLKHLADILEARLVKTGLQ